MMVKNFVERLAAGPFLDAETGDDGGAGGGTGTSVADNNGTAKAEGEGAAGTSGASKTGTAPDKSAEDARYKGLMSDLQKERKARQQYDADLKSARAELEQERRRIQALVGVNPKSKEEADTEEVRARLSAINPAFGDLTVEDIKAIREWKAAQAEMQEATNHHWVTHARTMLGSVTKGIEKALGGKLSDRQSQRVNRAYVAECESNPEFLARHDAGDQSAVEEFVKGWVEDFVEPAKRQALAGEIGRRPRVPGGKDRSIVGANDKPIDVNDPKAVEDMLVKGFRERGGEFRRR